jgi:predicted enzyme related to lactoylglutathione lyase
VSEFIQETNLQSDGGSKAATMSIADVKELHVIDLEASIKALEVSGGVVQGRWEYPEMIGAHCLDPQGNRLMLWQSK